MRIAARLLVLLVVLIEPGAPAAQSREGLTIDLGQGKTTSFFVELAVTPDQRARGLMFRQSMPTNEGMLFDFETERRVSFWMRNTLIPLDLLFIKGDGTIAGIHPMAEPLSEAPLSSGTPVQAVLEINGGLAQELGIEPGDKVRHRIFRKP